MYGYDLVKSCLETAESSLPACGFFFRRIAKPDSVGCLPTKTIRSTTLTTLVSSNLEKTPFRIFSPAQEAESGINKNGHIEVIPSLTYEAC
jgi:hypothetical protein